MPKLNIILKGIILSIHGVLSNIPLSHTIECEPGTCFGYSTSALSPVDAWQYCQDIGGRLVSAWNAKRDTCVENLLEIVAAEGVPSGGLESLLGATFGETPKDTFTGPESFIKFNQWYWDDEIHLMASGDDYSNCDESHSHSGICNNQEHGFLTECLAARYTHSKYSWEPVGCAQPKNFMCEFPCDDAPDPDTPDFDIKKYYETRGVWVATVANIDYPTTRGADLYEEHRYELQRIMDDATTLGLNTIYFHVRPNSDAFYNSDYECWSHWLTGQEGLAPSNPLEDPLKIILEMAHEHSIQVHAWINPYRASSGSITACEQNMMNRFPDDAFDYPPNSGSTYMDPGSRDVQAHIVNVVDDMLKKYGPGGSLLSEYSEALAGVHMDDYFYPYPSTDPGTGKAYPIPDDDTYAQFGEPGQSVEDFRRENVNSIIAQLQTVSHQYGVQFGVSPFGIYKSGQPTKIKGMSAPDEIFADTVAWLQRGIVDYIAPQLYWQDIPQDQSFSALVNYWTGEEANPLKIPVLTGLATYRCVPINICPQEPWSVGEISAQVEMARQVEGYQGHIHFSQKYLAIPYKSGTSCSSNALKRDTIDFDGHGLLSDEISIYLNLKQSIYNFNKAKALPNTPQYAGAIDTTLLYSSGALTMSYGDRQPDAIAIFSDYGKLLQIATVSDKDMTVSCELAGSDQTISCDLGKLVYWIPTSEQAKIWWQVSFIFKEPLSVWSMTDMSNRANT